MKGRLVAVLMVGFHRDIPQAIVGFRVAPVFGHEGRDDDLLGIDLENYLKLLHQVKVRLFELWLLLQVTIPLEYVRNQGFA